MFHHSPRLLLTIKYSNINVFTHCNNILLIHGLIWPNSINVGSPVISYFNSSSRHARSPTYVTDVFSSAVDSPKTTDFSRSEKLTCGSGCGTRTRMLLSRESLRCSFRYPNEVGDTAGSITNLEPVVPTLSYVERRVRDQQRVACRMLCVTSFQENRVTFSNLAIRECYKHG